MRLAKTRFGLSQRDCDGSDGTPPPKLLPPYEDPRWCCRRRRQKKNPTAISAQTPTRRCEIHVSGMSLFFFFSGLVVVK